MNPHGFPGEDLEDGARCDGCGKFFEDWWDNAVKWREEVHADLCEDCYDDQVNHG